MPNPYDVPTLHEITRSVARNPFNVASDWVGSCVIIIKRQRERGEMPEMNFLTLRDRRRMSHSPHHEGRQ